MEWTVTRQGNQPQAAVRVALRIVLVALSIGLAAVDPATAQSLKPGEHWVGTWATVPVERYPEGRDPQAAAPAAPAAPQLRAAGAALPPAPRTPQPVLGLRNQTLRQIVRVSVGGDRLRVVLTNVFGTEPLVIGKARVALREMESIIVPNSDRALTFGGRPGMTIPPGAIAVSDAVNLTVAPLGELAIDLYLPGDLVASKSPLTIHQGTGGLQTNYVSLDGDHTGAADFPVMTTTLSWYFLGRVEIAAPEEVGAVVLFGDSITDGSRSTADTNNRWPDHLAARVAAQRIRMGVLNAGFSGNRVLTGGGSPSGLARFDRDVLAQPGVTHVIVMLGINDIGMAGKNPSPTAEEIIAGYQQLATRAHAKGLRIYGATLSPFEGAFYWTPEGEAKRKAVNDWIRSNTFFDGIVDFDAILRDPKQPMRFLPRYNSSGDNLHPGDAGYKQMANALDLALLQGSGRPAGATR